MSIWWKFLVIVLAAVCGFILLWIFTTIGFEWDDTSGDENRKIVLLEAISVQLTILEIILAVVGLGLTALGFWGYQNIKKGVHDTIQRTVKEQLPELINTAVNERFPNEPAESVDNFSTTDKEKETILKILHKYINE